MSYRANYFPAGPFAQPLLIPTAKRGSPYQMRYEQPQMIYFQPNYQPQYRVAPQGQYSPAYIQPGYRMPVWVPGKFAVSPDNAKVQNIPIQQPIPRKNQIDNITYRQSMMTKGLVQEQKAKNKKAEEISQKIESSKFPTNGETGISIQNPGFTQDRETPPGFFNIIGRGALPSISFNYLACSRQ